MEPTLAEEIRVMLMRAYPVLSAKMLAVIEERDHLRWEAECLQVESK